MGISIQRKGGCVMTQIFLDGFNVITGFETVYGEGMPTLKSMLALTNSFSW
jgi:hypothetical protein